MDLNTFAKSIVDQAIGDVPVKGKPVERVKSPEAVKRGKARIASLGENVSEHARMAANKRWHPEHGAFKIKTGE